MEAVTIGQYRVTGVIGQGGMGAVYAAEHTLLGRPAAIKILLPALSKQQDIVMRFFNEARAATAIRHPGIVEIYDFGWTPEGAAYIVMERLEGETLARRVRRGVLSWQAALTVVRQIAGALGAAHAKGIVHRDLKPENVFLVPDPEVPGGERIKLLDFGIAKLAGDTPTSIHVTRTGAVMGTPTYMAPEQCRGVSIDHRADLYALGCVLFELCTGRPPFLGEGSGDVIAAHIHVPPPTLSGVRVKAPAPVEHLVQHLLTKAPTHRVQSADQLILAIDAITRDRRSPSAASSSAAGARAVSAHAITTLSGATTTSEQMSAVAPRPRRARVIAISAAATALTIVIGLAMRHSGQPPVTSHPGAPAVQEPNVPSPPAATPSPPAATPSPPVAIPSPSAATPSPPAATPSPPAATPSPRAATPSPRAATPSPRAATPSPPAATPSPPAATPSPPSGTPSPPAATPSPRAATPSPPAGPAPPSPTASRGASAANMPARDAAPREIIDVLVESTPPGAQLLLNGVVLGKTPYRGALPRQTAEATLVLRLAGYADKTITVRPDHEIHERIKLARTARNPIPERDQSLNPFAK